MSRGFGGSGILIPRIGAGGLTVVNVTVAVGDLTYELNDDRLTVELDDMANLTHLIKQDDLLPPVRLSITQNQSAYSLVGWTTPRFVMRASDGTTKVDAVATIEGDGSAGVLRYDWTGTDTDTAGTYRAEFSAVDGAGSRRTFPSRGYLRVEIEPDLG